MCILLIDSIINIIYSILLIGRDRFFITPVRFTRTNVSGRATIVVSAKFFFIYLFGFGSFSAASFCRWYFNWLLFEKFSFLLGFFNKKFTGNDNLFSLGYPHAKMFDGIGAIFDKYFLPNSLIIRLKSFFFWNVGKY